MESPLEKLQSSLASCELCPRLCRVNRVEGQIGYCRTGAKAAISSAGPHFGEEPPLVGSGGSGTIFFTGCNLGCVFCQNYEISHLREGRAVTALELAEAMHLRRFDCGQQRFGNLYAETCP